MIADPAVLGAIKEVDGSEFDGSTVKVGAVYGRKLAAERAEQLRIETVANAEPAFAPTSSRPTPVGQTAYRPDPVGGGAPGLEEPFDPTSIIDTLRAG